jgi:hypothetical protein
MGHLERYDPLSANIWTNRAQSFPPPILSLLPRQEIVGSVRSWIQQPLNPLRLARNDFQISLGWPIRLRVPSLPVTESAEGDLVAAHTDSSCVNAKARRMIFACGVRFIRFRVCYSNGMSISA